jgi:hypothetical protein
MKTATMQSSFTKVKKLQVQIKGRAMLNPKRSDHRLGQLSLEQDWQAIVLAIMDVDFETREIYMAGRDEITQVLDENKNKRGSVNVARFKIIGELLWSAENGIENEGYWSNAH